MPAVKIELKLDPAVEETKLVVVARERTDGVEALIRGLQANFAPPAVTAFRDEGAVLLPPEEILRFYADGKAVSVQTAAGVFSVRERLYELEERFSAVRFARISNSEIINLAHVTALDLSLSGTIRMTLTGGVFCYVSRRYLKRIKQTLGL